MEQISEAPLLYVYMSICKNSSMEQWQTHRLGEKENIMKLVDTEVRKGEKKIKEMKFQKKKRKIF